MKIRKDGEELVNGVRKKQKNYCSIFNSTSSIAGFETLIFKTSKLFIFSEKMV